MICRRVRHRIPRSRADFCVHRSRVRLDVLQAPTTTGRDGAASVRVPHTSRRAQPVRRDCRFPRYAPPASTTMRSAWRAVDTRCETRIVVMTAPRRAQPAQNVIFGFGIDARKTIVEDQHRRRSDQTSRQRRALFLSTRQRDAAFANGRIEGVGECNDRIAQIGVGWRPTRSARRRVLVCRS